MVSGCGRHRLVRNITWSDGDGCVDRVFCFQTGSIGPGGVCDGGGRVNRVFSL